MKTKTNKQCEGFIYYSANLRWYLTILVQRTRCEADDSMQSNPIQSTTDEIFTRDDALNGVIAVDDDEMSKGLGEEYVVRSTRGKV